MFASKAAFRSASAFQRCIRGQLGAVRVSGLRGAACNAGAKAGDYVAVHYTGTLDDGSTFDSSRQDGREPLEFQIGAGMVVRGFDMAVTGLEVNGTRKVRLDPEDAYGQRDPNMVLQLPASKGPAGLTVGAKVALNNGMPAVVTAITPDAITLDLNHELAGKHLTFDVQLVSLWPADRLKTAYFGAGCFWGVELVFQRLPGVVATEVGYCNGSVPEVTYEDVCTGNTGHAEVVKVVYDPHQISLTALMEVFFAKHDPTTPNRQGNDVGSQYRSGVYYASEDQKEEVQAAIQAAAKNFKDPIVTEVAEVNLYNAAEQYHQQYLAKGGRFGRPQSAKKGCNDPIRCYG